MTDSSGLKTELYFDVGVADSQGTRNYQEDSYAVTDLNSTDHAFDDLTSLIAVVADGVGGETSGDLASRTAVGAFCKALQHENDHDSNAERLETALTSANEAIAHAVEQQPEHYGMATTLVGTIVDLDSLSWVSVGDSHLYLIRDERLLKLNADHSQGAFLDEVARRGEISWNEAERANGRNMLRSVIEGGEIALTDIQAEPYQLQPEDLIILSSDGLNTLSDDDITKIALKENTAQRVASALVSAIDDTGSEEQDNTMVVAVRIARREAVTKPIVKPKDHRRVKYLVVLLLITIGFYLLWEAGYEWSQTAETGDYRKDHVGSQRDPSKQAVETTNLESQENAHSGLESKISIPEVTNTTVGNKELGEVVPDVTEVEGVSKKEQISSEKQAEVGVKPQAVADDKHISN
ncbi:MAG: protein phosphatase 2C domain-containing protein [Candidatus Thiodiazotropha taylori]